jgi:uncharacterized membrane protein YkvA (DUF1232 family)
MPQKKRTTPKHPKSAGKPAARRTAPSGRGSSPDATSSKELLLETAVKVGDAELRKVIQERERIVTKAASGPPLNRLVGDIRLILSLLQDYASGKYREIPFGAVAAMTGAMVYVLSPVGLIPDIIPGLGLVDDAAVVAACLQLVANDIARYRAHQARQ